MKRQLDVAIGELAAMCHELSEAQNHPIKNAMQKTLVVMQSQVLDMHDKLSELEQGIVDGCKNAVAAFKEQGISALDNIARFFKVRPMLEAIRSGLDGSIQYDNRAIAKIEAISAEYHEAGRHLKNMGRAMLGKEAVQ